MKAKTAMFLIKRNLLFKILRDTPMAAVEAMYTAKFGRCYIDTSKLNMVSMLSLAWASTTTYRFMQEVKLAKQLTTFGA